MRVSACLLRCAHGYVGVPTSIYMYAPVWLSVCCLHAYEPIYMAMYVYSLVYKRMHVVISKHWLICIHTYIHTHTHTHTHTYMIAYVWQGSMPWVHNYIVIPSMLISQVCSWVGMKVCVVIILCTCASRYIRVCMYVHMFTNIEISKWLQMFKS